MKIIKTPKAVCLCGVFLSMLAAHAGNVFKADNANNLNIPASWVGGATPTATDVAVWNFTVQVNNTSSLGADTNWAGIQILDPALPITISAGNTLTLGPSGIDMSLATNNLTLANNVSNAVAQTWNVANGLTLTVSGAVSGPSTSLLTKNGNGILILGSADTYSGGTIINGGTAQPNTVTSFGTAAVTNNGGSLLLSVFPNAGIMANAFNVTGTSLIDMNNRSISAVLSGAWSGNGTILVTNDTASGSTLTFGGASGGNMANFTGSIVMVASASGTPSAGTIRFNNGGSLVNSGNSLMSVNLGTNSTMALAQRDSGGTSIGELTGGPGTIVKGSTGASGGTTTWSIGGKNTSATFAGTIINNAANELSALTKVGTGTFTLTGPNTYTGATTVSAGILQIGDGVTAGAGQLGTANVTDNATLSFARPDAISVANVITGSGNLVQAGASVLTLSSANTYTGSTIVTNGGTIQAGIAGAISPATSLILGGTGTAGTLDMAGYDVQVSALNSGSGATGSTVGSTGGSNPTTFTVNATNGSSIFGGTIQDTLPGGSGIVALAVQNGKLTVTGPNSYSGSTTVSNGTLVVGAGGSIASSTSIILATVASTLDVSAGGLSLSSGHILSGVGVLTGAVNAASALINPATNGTVGTLSFSNNLSLSGGDTIHFDLSASPSSGNDQILVGGTLSLAGVNTIEINPLTGSLGTGTYKLLVANAVSGGAPNLSLVGTPGSGLTAVLSVTGTEVDLVVNLSGAPAVWHGDGSLNQWDYTTANWRSNGVPTLFADGNFTVFDDTGSTTPAIDITAPVAPGAITVNASVNYTFGSVSGNGKLTGTSTLIKTNTGTLTLLTPNDSVGGTFINQGTIRVGNGSVAGVTLGNANVLDNGSLVFNQPDSEDFTNIISGTGSVTQQGSSTVILSGNNIYRGTTTISSGTLQVGDGNASGTLGTNTVTDNAALAFNRSDSVTQSGAITGSGTLTVIAGTVSVTANNDYAGATTINSGSTLQLGTGGTTGSVPLTNVTDNGTLAFNHSVDETNIVPVSGSGGITKLAANTLTLAATNVYNGDTTISAGTLKVGVSGTIPFGGGFGNVVLNGGSSVAGTLDMNGFDVTLNGINGNSNSVLGKVVNNFGTGTNNLIVGAGDATTTFRGYIQDNTGGGKIAFTKTGAGMFTLSGTNNYTGGTVLSNGILALGSNGANNSGGYSGLGPTNQPVIFNGGTLQLFGYGPNTTPNYNSFYNPLVVPAGQSGSLLLFPRGPASGNPGLGSPLTGGGTLNLVCNYVRDSLDGNWSAFTGLINVTAYVNPSEFRINNQFGYASASVFLNDGVIMDRASGASPTNDIGELGGTSGAIVGPGNSSSGSPTWRVGWKNTTATFAGTIANDGTTSIIKVGTGKWILTGANTYSGSTTISNGVLALGDGVTDGSIGNSTLINIASGTFLEVSGRSDGKLSLNASQQLRGRGTIRGILDTTPGGLVSPGGGTGGSTGMLTVTNFINLGGTAWMKLNRGNTPNSDQLVSLSTITYGGTLVVTNVGARLQAGDTFSLFVGGGLSVASFGTTVLPSYYTWDTSNLGVNGSIKVTTVLPAPSISSVDYSQLANGSITLNAVNGAPNGPVTVLTSTDLSLPLNSWTTVTTTTFDGSGNLSLPVTVDPAKPQSFFVLQAF